MEPGLDLFFAFFKQFNFYGAEFLINNEQNLKFQMPFLEVKSQEDKKTFRFFPKEAGLISSPVIFRLLM